MGYYVEKAMKDLRGALEGKVLRWPHVRTRRMFGCPCYEIRGRLFAFLVTKGVVVTRLSPAEREAIARRRTIRPFQAGTKLVPAWIQIPLTDPRDLDGIVPVVRKSYERTLTG